MKIKNPKIAIGRFSAFSVMTIMALATLLSVAGSIITPGVAHATGETYILYYPDDEATKKELKEAYNKEGSDKFESPVMENVSILAYGGTMFGDEPQRLVYDRDVNSQMNDRGLGQNKNGSEQYFTRVYFCDSKTGERGYTEPSGNNPYYRVTYTVAFPDMSDSGDLFDTKIHNNTAVGATKILKITPATTGGSGQAGDSEKTETIKELNSDHGTGDLGDDINKISNAACRPKPTGNDKISVKNYYSAATAEDKKRVASLLEAANSGAANTNLTGVTDDSAPGLKCATKLFNPLTWLLCPAVKGLINIVGAIDDIITSQLSVGTDNNGSNPNQIFCDKDDPGSDGAQKSCKAYESAWKSFRNIALGLMVVSGLIIVIAQALGWEILDAYAIRKTLPRLIIAAVAITLSWKLMGFFVEFTNDLGYGIRSLIYKPFADANFDQATLGGGGTVAASLVGGVAIGALGIFGLLSFAATAALAVAVAFLVLIVRQLVIIVLIIFAPIAILAFILPNTQKVYKLWWESFSKALLMFPIIAAFIAVGRVFAAVSATSGGGTLGDFIGFVAYFAPYFLLPLTFRFAGGALANIGGFIDNKGKGGFDRLKKFRQGQYQSHGGRKIENAGRRVLSTRADFNDKLQDIASRDSMNPLARKAIGRFASTTAGHNLEALQSAKRQNVSKELNDQIATGRDEEIRGLLIDKKSATEANGQMRISTDPDTGVKTRQYKSLGGAWIDEAKVDAGQRRWGNDNFAKQAALAYEIKKTDSVDDVKNLKENYGRVALAGGMSEKQAGGAWQGATFENQNQHLELKHTKWQDGSMDAGRRQKFASEAYEKKGSYAMSQMHASTIQQLGTAFDGAQADGDLDTQQKIAGVAETVVSRYGGAGGVAGMEGERPIAAPAAGAAPGMAAAAPTVQVNAQGAGNVNESFRELAVKTGVYRQRPNGPDGRSADPTSDTTHRPFPDNRPQN